MVYISKCVCGHVMSLLQILLTLTVCGSFATFTCPRQMSEVCRCYTKGGSSDEKNVVDCSSRDLRELPEFDIDENTRISMISLQNNSLQTISEYSFSRRLNVDLLDLSQNPIRNAVEDGLLNRVTINLKSLSLRKTGVSLKRPIGFINGLTSLEELDLSKNPRFSKVIPRNMFEDSGIHSLRILSLSASGLYEIKDGAFRGLNNLHTLDLSFNFLSKIPNAIRSLYMLRKLNLRKNDILEVNRGDFRELHCLEELDLSKNLFGQMEAFKAGAFLGTENSLTSLFLHDSHMVTIPTLALSQVTKLRRLDISNNKISFMSSRSFVGEYHIEDLDISGNPWLLNEDMFEGVKHTLVNLTMRGIDLQRVPTEPLSKLYILQKLDLSYNQITRLTNESLLGITARWLVFKGNKIRHISPEVFAWYRMPLKVDLSHNRLERVRFVFESPRCTFYNLNITDNNLTCDCDIEKLVNTISVEYLDGNCRSDGGERYSFTDSVTKGHLESRCGKSEARYCAWWIPKKSHGISTVYYCSVLLCSFIAAFVFI